MQVFKTITFGHLSTDISHFYHTSVSINIKSLYGVLSVAVIIGQGGADFRDSYAAEQIVGKP